MIEIIRTESGLADLQSQWSEILTDQPSPMATFEWIRAAIRAFYNPQQLFVVIVRNADKRLDAVAPLVRTQGNDLSSATLIGSNCLFEPSGLLFRNSNAFDELITGLIELGIPLNLKRLAHSLGEVEKIKRTCRGQALLLAKNGAGSPFLPIGTSWKQFEGTISSDRRSDLRRALRRAESFGDVEFEVKTPSIKECGACFDELVRVELNSWKGRSGSALGLNQHYHQFFSEFSIACAEKGNARFGFMRVNGKPIAANLSVQYGRALWTLKVGYDDRYGRCSPGILLMHEMVRYAFEQKLDSFQFLGEPEKWIQLWSPQVLTVPSLRIFPYSAHGLSQFGLAVAGTGLRRSKRFTKHALNFFIGNSAPISGIVTKANV